MAAVHPLVAPRQRLLLVEDDRQIRLSFGAFLEDRFDVTTCETAECALVELERIRPDVVLTDLLLPGQSGLTLVSAVRRAIPECVVLVMTGVANVETAVEAMKAGAHDFLTKPVDPDFLDFVVDRALERQKTALEVKRLRELLVDAPEANQPLGNSPQMRRIVHTAAEVADSSASVLITGESGSGKEVIARYIHDVSGRSNGPFVPVNCGAVPETLIESEFFGHEVGAFTGATKRHVGRFERAQGGTIFLDEIGELPPAVQVKLLRALQDHEIERLGSSMGPIRLDVRIIAATNRDLARAVSEGSFREDLYYRLNVIHLDVPPLRERKSDIPDLWAHFVARVASREGLDPPETSDEALDAMYAHDWPGNVRELENAAERAVILSHGARIEVGHLPAPVAGQERKLSQIRIPGATLAEIEKAAILETLAAVGGSTSKCAEILGISVRKIQYRLSQWRREAATAVTVDE